MPADVGTSRSASSWLDALLLASPARILAAALVVQLAVLAVDVATLDSSLGVLYVIPVMLASLVLRRSQIVILSVVLAILRGLVTPFHAALENILRFAMALSAYAAAGLLINELVTNRRRTQLHLAEITRQQQLRREAEEQLRLLAESSPAAIFTVDKNGRVLSANDATRTLLGVPKSKPAAELQVFQHLPVMREALMLDPAKGRFRTAVQTQGRRADGQPFAAQIWFSLYEAGGSSRLAAIAVDVSDEMRDREEQGQIQLVENHRIVASAIAHEIRNVCAAASLLHANLGRIPGVSGLDDFRALGSLVKGLEGIADFQLRQRGQGSTGAVDLRDVLSQFRLVIQPAWEEAHGSLNWAVPQVPLFVEGTSYGLLQALLNLSQNSLRAAHGLEHPEFDVTVERVNGTVKVAVSDSGPGVREPAKLFQPFQPGAEHTGLGLYIARSIVRGYGGDLRYEPANGKCQFVIELRPRRESKAEIA